MCQKYWLWYKENYKDIQSKENYIFAVSFILQYFTEFKMWLIARHTIILWLTYKEKKKKLCFLIAKIFIVYLLTITQLVFLHPLEVKAVCKNVNLLYGYKE